MTSWTTDIINLAREDKLDQIKHILDDPINRVVDDRGKTALHNAAEEGNSKIVKELLNRGAKLNSQDSKGQTALHAAALAGKSQLLEELLNLGADANIQDSAGDTALHAVCKCVYKKEHSDLLELDDSRADSDDDDDDYDNYLSKYCLIIDCLLEQPGLDIELRNEEGRTVLGAALHNNIPSALVLKLIQHGAALTRVDEDQCTSLHLAVGYNNLVFNEILSHEEIDINQADANGNTALMKACERFTERFVTPAVERLLSNGAKANLCNKDGTTALHALCSEVFQQCSPRAVDALLRDDPDILNAPDEKGFTPLHKAIQKNAYQYAIHFLTLESVAVNGKTKDELRQTNLHMACDLKSWECGRSKLEMVKKLIGKGAHLNEQDAKGNTALHLACSSFSSWEVVQNLLEQEGTHLHKLNRRGFTPLMVAAEANRSLDFIFKLLSHTGGTILEFKQICTSKKRNHSIAFESDDDKDECEEQERRNRQKRWAVRQRKWKGREEGRSYYYDDWHHPPCYQIIEDDEDIDEFAELADY